MEHRAHQNQTATPIIETDVLVVGTGPAGASLACFLAQNGELWSQRNRVSINGLSRCQGFNHQSGVVHRQYTSSPLYEQCNIRYASSYLPFRTPPDTCWLNGSYRVSPGPWNRTGVSKNCHAQGTSDVLSLRRINGRRGIFTCAQLWHRPEEICKLNLSLMFGYIVTDGQGEFQEASPCEQADLPQSILEPILLRVATQNGFNLRWDTRLVDFVQDEGTGCVRSVIEDTLSGQHITVISPYLCGADGGRSTVAKKLQLPFNNNPGGGLALNVLCEADLVSSPHRDAV